jgi:MFS family permease
MTDQDLTKPADMSGRRRVFALTMIMINVGALGVFIGLIWPLMSLIMEGQGEEAWLIGVMSAMSPISVMGTMMIAGRVLSRGQPILLMLIGMTVGLAVITTMALYQAIELWIPLRFIMGAGIAMPWLLGETLVNALAPEGKRGRVISLYAIVFFLGMALGPLLLEQVGPEPTAFWWANGFLILAALPLLALREVDVNLHPPQGANLWGLVRAAPMLMCAGLLAGLIELAVYSFAPIFALRSGLGEEVAVVVLSIFTFGGLALQPLIGFAADRVDRRILLTAVGWLTALISSALYFTLGEALATQIVFFVLGGTALAFYALGLVLLGQRFTGGELALANAGFILMYQIGSIVGPTLTGWSLGAIGPVGFILVTGVAGLAFGLLGVGRLSTAGRA